MERAVPLKSTIYHKEQIQFGRVVIPNLTLPGNPGSSLILVTEIEIKFVFPDESRKLPRIQLRGNIFLRRLSVASFAIDHPSWGQTITGNWHIAKLVIAKSNSLNAPRFLDVDCMNAVPRKRTVFSVLYRV
jgi:hypothetical protein